MASQKIGSYAFLIGVIIALIAGLAQVADAYMGTAMMANLAGIVALVLVILGLIVGFLNIKDKHVSDFLIATIAVAMIGLVALSPAATGVVDPIIVLINAIVSNIVTLVAPAALIVGLKQIIALSKEQVM